ncbi:DUF402 domain-containing protein [Paeniglutamicibacter sp. R2-26]|uniref:DUF402 domain-containing protein n=1 Tax=Paeniglutamicibacter sp. R2-26 TaxID=3144417 RepID=UPI003EE7EED3
MRPAAAIPADLPRAPAHAAAGDIVVARAWKYDGQPHWVVPGYYLGSDAHGHWIYQPAGSLVSRPGHGHWADTDAVCLVPHTGYWVGTFYDAPEVEDLRTYLDLSCNIGWRELPRGGWEVNSVDMDLDVVDSRERGVFVDDRDEFAEHRAQMGYPRELAEAIEHEAASLLNLVGTAHAPFDDTTNAWFARGRAAHSGATTR